MDDGRRSAKGFSRVAEGGQIVNGVGLFLVQGPMNSFWTKLLDGMPGRNLTGFWTESECGAIQLAGESVWRCEYGIDVDPVFAREPPGHGVRMEPKVE